jgi:hypothetical protein
MVGERMAALLIVGHQTCSLHRRRRALCLAVIAWAIKQGQKHSLRTSSHGHGIIAQASTGRPDTGCSMQRTPLQAVPKVLNSTPRDG